MTAPTLPPSQVEALREKAEAYQRASAAYFAYAGPLATREYFRLNDARTLALHALSDAATAPVILALLATWHADRTADRARIAALEEDGMRMRTAAHFLLEAYEEEGGDTENFSLLIDGLAKSLWPTPEPTPTPETR